jgi:hypothetical protein
MALYADRVKDSTSLTGTGAVTLSGTASTGFQSFATAFGASPVTVAYCIADQTGNNWEVGTGVFNGTTGLTRVTVLGSSNGGSLVNFTGGTQDVFCTIPAKFVDLFTSTNQGTVAASGGGTSNFLRADGSWAIPSNQLAVQGMMGDDGLDGDVGPPGLRGATGATGATGAIGAAGDDGLDGDSFLLGIPTVGTPLSIAGGGTSETTSNGAFNRLSGYTVNNGINISLNTTSTYNQFCIGIGGDVTLPDVTTIPLGYTYHVVNQSSVSINVFETSNTTVIAAIPINTGLLFTCIRTTAPQETAWIYATSDLWSTSDGVSSGNTGITGTGSLVLKTSASLTSPTITTAPSIGIQNAGASGGLQMIRNSDASTASTRTYYDSSTSVACIYNSSGNLFFNTNATLGGSAGSNQMRVSPTASAANYVNITGAAATGSATPANVTITGTGTDTNVNLVLATKGTGTVKFGTHSTGTVTQTGYITITDSGGTTRRLLVG